MDKNGYLLSELSDLMYLYSGDVKMLHFHMKGMTFLSVHKQLDKLYELTSDAYDVMAELSISQGETIDNPSLAFQRTNWKPLTLKTDTFTETSVIGHVQNTGYDILSCLKSIDSTKYDSFVYSEIDDIVANIDKIVSYRFGQIAKDI